MDKTVTVHEIIDPSTLEEIGKFRRTHALRGELNAEVYDGLDEQQLSQLAFVIVEIDGIPTPFRMESIRLKGASTMLIKLAGVDSADRAACFVNQPIYADTQTLESFLPDDDEENDDDGVYAADLIGYRAVDTDGREIGAVQYVDVSTANPLMELLTANGQTVLIPVNGPFIVNIDPESKVVEIEAPDTLLGLNAK